MDATSTKDAAKVAEAARKAIDAIATLRRSDGWTSRFEGCASGDASEWAGPTLHDCEDALRLAESLAMDAFYEARNREEAAK